MSQPDLEHAHRLLTAAMIAQAKGTLQPLPEGHEFSDDELARLRGLPVIGCHIDPAAQLLVIIMAESEEAHAALHEYELQRALGGIPFQITYATHRDHAAPSKTEACRPLWGGVEMATTTNAGTLTLVVRKDGADYTLVSAHIVGIGLTGQAVGQTRTTTGKYGTVKFNPAGPMRCSDSALASIDESGITGQPDYIWRAPDAYYEVTHKARNSDLTVGRKVYMQGATYPSLREGRITATNVTSVRPSGLVLIGQITASYTATHGDSGAPVFLAGAKAAEVTFAGIAVGPHGNDELFSHWDGIRADLDL